MLSSKILIVEDDPGLREALEDTLLLGGYTVFTAVDVEQVFLLEIIFLSSLLLILLILLLAAPQ